jgi:hypothetical protein
MDQKVERNEIHGNGEWKPTPIEVTHPDHVDPDKIRLFFDPPWRLRMTIDKDRSYLKIKIVRAAPLTQPDDYICMLDAKDEVICMVDRMVELTAENQEIVISELKQRYLTAQVERVDSIRNEFGVSYWQVQTDRGSREFVAKNVAENAQWIDEGRMMILDVDGNRFEFASIPSLDKKSQSLIEEVL